MSPQRRGKRRRNEESAPGTTRGDRAGGEGRGRPPRLPRDFDDALAQQRQSAERWDRLHVKVWSGPDRSLMSYAARLAADEVTPERLRQVRELAAQLRRVADQAQEQAESAEQVVREFERILDERPPRKGLAQAVAASAAPVR